MAVTEDRSTIITADVGSESMLVLWNSKTGAPIQSVSQPHKLGIIAMDISPDDEWLATVGAVDPKSGEQEVGTCNQQAAAGSQGRDKQQHVSGEVFKCPAAACLTVCARPLTDRAVVIGHHPVQRQGEAMRADGHPSRRRAALGALQHERHA